MAKVPLITLLLCVVIALSSCERKNERFSISYTDTDLKNPISSFKSYISSADFHISPEAVEK
jgi:hypothetical protein